MEDPETAELKKKARSLFSLREAIFWILAILFVIVLTIFGKRYLNEFGEDRYPLIAEPSI